MIDYGIRKQSQWKHEHGKERGERGERGPGCFFDFFSLSCIWLWRIEAYHRARKGGPREEKGIHRMSLGHCLA
jgi:hypothetical protein